MFRYLFVLATGARELPLSPIGSTGRLFAKVAALASVAALALTGTGRSGGIGAGVGSVLAEVEVARQGLFSALLCSPSPFLCMAGVAVLRASYSVDFCQIGVVLPPEKAAKVTTAVVAVGVVYGKTVDTKGVCDGEWHGGCASSV